MQKIIDKLKTYGYRYKVDGHSLIVYLPMLCFLKIKFEDENIIMTSHALRPSIRDRIEFNFLLYSMALCFGIWYFPNLNSGAFFLLGIFIIYCVVAFVKTESMRIIVHRWLENE